ncbi:hypothetical protein V8F33_014239, partial [Rhypophila sp. PSN 637]
SYKLNKSAQLTLSYRAVANDFREEVRQLTKARIPAGNRIAKGSFGPSFAAKKGHTTYQEDASDSEVEPGSDGGEQNGQKRGSGSEANTTCPGCDQFHRLEKCWYIFPELAPEDFVEREHVRMRVKETLLDPVLQERVEALKKKASS